MATASAISDAVTYKAVDILKVENYKLFYFGIPFSILCIDYSLCSLQANIRSTTVYLYSLSLYHARPSFCLSILRLLLFGCSWCPGRRCDDLAAPAMRDVDT